MAEQFNDEFERIWKEMAVTLSRHYRDIWLEGLRKTRMKLIHDSRYTSQDSNKAHHEYESGSL
jgi:hypothetical protein